MEGNSGLWKSEYFIENLKNQNLLFWNQKYSEMLRNRVIFIILIKKSLPTRKILLRVGKKNKKQKKNAGTLEPVLKYMLNVINENTRLIS